MTVSPSTQRTDTYALKRTTIRPSRPSMRFPPTPGAYGNSDAYDRFMGRWSSRLARQFLRFVRLEGAESVLDVGSGTGSLTALIATSTAASRIVGIDPVAPFVRVARQRFANRRVTFDQGEACDLPYVSADFDAALTQLAFHHFPDQRSALLEMLRVTRPGGIVAACDWDRGPGMEMFHILWKTLAEVDPGSGVQGSRQQFAGPGSLLGCWQACGLKNVEEKALVVPLRFASFEDFWTPFVEGPSSVLVHLNRLSPSLKEDFRTKLRDRLLEGKQDGSFELQARAWAVRGWAP